MRYAWLYDEDAGKIFLLRDAKPVAYVVTCARRTEHGLLRVQHIMVAVNCGEIAIEEVAGHICVAEGLRSEDRAVLLGLFPDLKAALTGRKIKEGKEEEYIFYVHRGSVRAFRTAAKKANRLSSSHAVLPCPATIQ